jgi:hypothetical protein
MSYVFSNCVALLVVQVRVGDGVPAIGGQKATADALSTMDVGEPSGRDEVSDSGSDVVRGARARAGRKGMLCESDEDEKVR